MKKSSPYTVEKLAWKDIRKVAKTVNAPLATAIDRMDCQDDLPLYRVRYPFGEDVIRQGVLYLPNSRGRFVPFDDSSIPETVTRDLNYNNVPLGLMTKNCMEVYFELPDRIFPLRMFPPGVVLGLWENMDQGIVYYPRRIWSISSGARSFLVLPKLSDKLCFKNLCKKYRIHSRLPRRLIEHHKIFIDISRSPNFERQWYSEIIFFSGKWLDGKRGNAHTVFRNYLLEQAWQLSQYARNRETLAIVWELFARSLTERRVKPDTYVMDTLKHLVGVGTGSLPGFRAATDDDIAGPMVAFQKVIVEDYGLRSHIPTIMHLTQLDVNRPLSTVYYSLQFPTLTETFPKSRSPTSIMNEMRELKELMETFVEEAEARKLRVEDTPIALLIDKIAFDYFHGDPDMSGEIDMTHRMPKHDPALLYYYDKYKRQFAESSTFLKGCVRMQVRPEK